MKRFFSIILCITMLSSCLIFSTTAYADDIDKNGAYAFTSANSTLTIYNDSAMVDKTETTMNEYPWFTYKSAIEHIVIADGVTKISDFAFCREDNLLDVVIPDSVTSIGTAAFASSSMLKELTLSENITYIGNSAFGFDDNMDINKDFLCNCSSGSYAQDWCLQNYVLFNSPFSETGKDIAKTTTKGQQYLWSFVPQYDCKITYYSNCKYDTIGLIYDADNYNYNTNISIMRDYAYAYNDDNGIGDDTNFKITTQLKANKRYYLATKYKLNNRIGDINVEINTECLHTTFVNNICQCGKTYCEINGHNWQDATINAPKTCENCKLTDGDKLASANVNYTNPETNQNISFDLKNGEINQLFTTNMQYKDNIFLGWFDNDQALNKNINSFNEFKNITAKFTTIGRFYKDINDEKKIDYYKDFELAGVQIRQNNTADSTTGTTYGGLRFIASFSNSLIDAIGSENIIEYGFVTTSRENADANAIDNDNYMIKNGDKNVKRINCNTGNDHRVFDNYRLFTMVIDYEGNESLMSQEIVARAYIIYKDANGVNRIYYNDYDGTNVYGGCSISYDRAVVLSRK